MDNHLPYYVAVGLVALAIAGGALFFTTDYPSPQVEPPAQAASEERNTLSHADPSPMAYHEETPKEEPSEPSLEGTKRVGEGVGGAPTPESTPPFDDDVVVDHEVIPSDLLHEDIEVNDDVEEVLDDDLPAHDLNIPNLQLQGFPQGGVLFQKEPAP